MYKQQICSIAIISPTTESTLVKAVDMGNDMSEAVSSITFDDVGRVGTSRQKLNEYHIDPKVRSCWYGKMGKKWKCR
jgi:hypothetical protein